MSGKAHRVLTVGSATIVGWFALLPIVLCGCGDEHLDRLAVYPVRGQLFVEGKPAEGAQVILHPVDSSVSVKAQWESRGGRVV